MFNSLLDPVHPLDSIFWQCPVDVNPAEFMLEAIGAGSSPRIGHQDWKDVWLESPECEIVREEVENIKTRGRAIEDTDKAGRSTCKPLLPPPLLEFDVF